MVANSEFQVHGILSSPWNGYNNPLPTFHRHNEIEINLLVNGRVTYTIAGHSTPIPLGRLCVFWGGFPHRIIEWQPHSEIWAMAIPLTTFLHWPLPRDEFVYRLLHGMMLAETDTSRASFDLDLMRRWDADLQPLSTIERRELVLLELQARIRRLAANDSATPILPEHTGEAERVDKMLQYIAANYARRLSINEIARAASTHPSYAMELFKTSCGVSLMQYVNDQRVAHARRMLATTSAKILDVALESGFGSESQFYNVFRQACGQTPRQYAKANTPKPNRPRKSIASETDQ